jgi:hypothetical protein
MPMMKSQYDVILNGTHGHCIELKANVAVWIPPAAVDQAISLGARETGDAAPTPATDIAAPAKTADNEAAFAVELDQAILRILTRKDEADYKRDLTPKVSRVIAEMDPAVRRATATEVSEAFQRLQERVQLAE